MGVDLAKNVFQVCVWLDDGSLPGTKKYVPVKTIEQQDINALEKRHVGSRIHPVVSHV
ncbi:hypothetical protein [Xenorhabdus bovienii]|uniref:hypothetical protein n=1 Tax=Xenorhabdus bovienii TaxID=40576 RepID=UPI0004D5D460|nr:hypothetical protein [Xenorhabdus bovienii]CDG86563.1 hypothetical protein XBFFR1_120001 [Xenorhabdus bovienii str. feltiae France]